MDVRSVDFKSPSASGGAGFRAFRGEIPPPSLSAKVLPRTPRDPRLKQEVIAVNYSDTPLFSISHSFLFPSDLNCAIMGVVYGKGSKHEKQISFDEFVGGPPVERMGGH